MARFNQQDEAPWISVSDIMTGLMVIFLFIAIAYIIESQRKQYTLDKAADSLGIPHDSIYSTVITLEKVATSLREKQDSITRILARYHNNRGAIYRRIREELGEDFQAWGAQIDSTALTIRFNGEATKFAPSSDYLSRGFKRVLDDFLPRYLAIVTDPDFREDILEIKIEGHAFNSGQGYTTILQGSQNRARNVLLYVRGHESFKALDRKVREDLDFKLVTTGMGYERMIDSEGEYVHISGRRPCENCSRRVEFTIVTSTEQVLQNVGRTL